MHVVNFLQEKGGIGYHNYHWFSHLMDGSGAEQVLRHAPYPILIVRKEERDFLWLEQR